MLLEVTDAVLDEAFLLLSQYAFFYHFQKSCLCSSFKVFVLSAVHDISLVHNDVVDTVLFKLNSVVWMGHKKDVKSIL